MNNLETGRMLIAEAEADLERVHMEYNKARWNRAVRSAQEAVEHCLKGLLKIMGVEYPKEHDVGD
ncbi:MAG TPA: HEPN domain-containing protein, partial [Desulfobacterales bacterium]|nr:HEPN domain-containing protein [Desulfobacterales bacterium]